ncbi:MAG TPA: Fic family protein [Patescibacteria group bacterium]|nr:Fic family protein [Patescibacteria group bacterium]
MYEPKYSITNIILKYIGIIEGSKQVIDNAPLLPYYEKKFQQEAMVRSVYHGTHLEGNELNKTQAEKVLEGQEIIARERDIQEVINYRRVMDFIGEEFAKTPEREQPKVNESLIKKLHALTVEKILSPDRCGQFRTSQVVVKNSQTGQVSFRPPQASEVEPGIKDLISFIQKTSSDDLHPVLKSGIVHYELVRIHPFVDGNGRVARALSTLILFQEGYDIRKFFSLEEYFDHDAIAYYEALQSVGKSGELTKWLEYFCKGLAIELSKIKDKVEKISVDSKLKAKLGGRPLLLTERQIKIIEYIQETNYLQNNAFASLFPMVSEDTVLNDLKVLIKAGLIKKTGKTKAAKYVME